MVDFLKQPLTGNAPKPKRAGKAPKKILLHGIAKSPKHVVIAVEKKKATLAHLKNFLYDLSFPKWELERLDQPLERAPGKKYKNTLYDDKYLFFQHGQYRIDLFFGKKRVIISVFTESDRQEELTQRVLRFAEEKAGQQ